MRKIILGIFLSGTIYASGIFSIGHKNISITAGSDNVYGKIIHPRDLMAKLLWILGLLLFLLGLGLTNNNWAWVGQDPNHLFQFTIFPLTITHYSQLNFGKGSLTSHYLRAGILTSFLPKIRAERIKNLLNLLTNLLDQAIGREGG